MAIDTTLIADVPVRRLKYPHRCSICLEPATKVERFTGDPLYQRPLCDKHAAERPALNTSDPTKLTALQEQRLRRANPVMTVDKKTGMPRLEQLHRIQQQEKHSGHNPSVGLPKPPKKGHMPKRQQALKSEMLRTFRRLVTPVFIKAKLEAAERGVEFTGLSVDALGKVASQASQLAVFKSRRMARERKRKVERVKQISRFINAGVLRGAVSTRRKAGGR